MSSVISQFEMVPKKGFFGIGKSKAECFTCPKFIYPELIKEFELSSKNLQKEALLTIDGKKYPFLIRLVNMDRSRVRKLLPSILKKRSVIQFSWKSHKETQVALKNYLEKPYKSLLKDNNAVVDSIMFRYIGEYCFELISNNYEGKNNNEIESDVELNNFEDFLEPTWRILNEFGQLSKAQIDDLVAKDMKLTDAQIRIPHNGGPRTSFDYKMCWVRTYLKQAGVSKNPRQGFWENTEYGLSLEKFETKKIKQSVNEFQKNKKELKEKSNDDVSEISSPLIQLSANIPSSFVMKKIKLADDRGNGEAKLYIGPFKNKEEYDKFFNNWHPLNIYELDRVELLLYLQDVEQEFSKHGKYKEVSRKLYRELSQKINQLDDNRIDLTSFSDKSRYYIRGNSEAWKLVRQTSLPLITSIEIEIKSRNTDGSCDYILRVVKSDKEREVNPTSGQKLKTTKKKRKSPIKKKNKKTNLIKEKSRKIPNELKDRVWNRCSGICQANFTIDPKFDKNTGEICGSNINLEFDHIVPFSRGGKTTYRNLQLLCRKHNRMKSDKELY